MSVAITGCEGLMGRELMKLMPAIGISHREMEIRDRQSVCRAIGAVKPDLVVHLAACVDTVRAETDKQFCYDTNVIGTRNVARCAPTLYVSSDYVFDGEKGDYVESDYPNPKTFYGLTKLLGEQEVLQSGGKVLRLSFKPRPYKHSRVPKEMYFSGGYVDDMAQEIARAVKMYDRLPPITHVGIKRISLLDLARQTRDVEEISLKDVALPIPRDVSFDLTVWKGLCSQS